MTAVPMQGFESTNGTQPSFEPFASSQDPWKAFPDQPAPAEEAPRGADWADFEGATPFEAPPHHPPPSGVRLLNFLWVWLRQPPPTTTLNRKWASLSHEGLARVTVREVCEELLRHDGR